ncbi:MAG: MFS transporter [Bacteroidetes bacterium]|nr:MFS transporter [Bacteroidota bacterium]
MMKKGRIVSWAMFDFANTAFSVIIVTVVYSKYFTNYVAGGQKWIWGLLVSISMIIAALLSPAMGAIADLSRNRKRFLLFFTLISVICTALMYFVYKGDILYGALLFILANIGFEAGLVFYDAFLPNLTEKKNFGRVSGYGYAAGYLGALIVLLIALSIIPDVSSPIYYDRIRLTFLVASAFFMVFSIPLFLFLSEPKIKSPIKKSLIKEGLKKSFNTFKALFIEKKFPSISKFLISFFLYNDAIITIIVFASIFASNVLHMEYLEIIIFFVIIQSTAILGSFIFGIISDHIGPKKTITITLVIWLFVVVGAALVENAGQFYLIGLLAGLAIGSSQSCSRSLMALLIPKSNEAEYFGFYDGLFGKSSAVIGPLFYGIVADISGERIATLGLGLFFIAGLIILQGVKDPHKIKN